MAYRTRSDVRVGARSWWGQRWLDLVEEAFPTRTSRFGRGDVDARTGQLSGLTVLPGRLAARAQGDHATAHRPEVEVPTLDDEQWDAVTRLLAESVRPAVELLHDRMPENLEERFREAGVPLYPDLDEIESRCNCGVAGGPCRHVAALHHAFARATDEDPLLLFALRGREPDRFQAGLRAARAGTDDIVLAPSVETVEAQDIEVEGFDRLQDDLDRVRVHPHLTEEPDGVLTRLGPPPGVDDPRPLEQLLWTATETAWKLAAGEGSDAADDELLLAELRARRTATGGELADALGWSPDRTLDMLNRLYEDGTAMRTGKGLDARYRAG